MWPLMLRVTGGSAEVLTRKTPSTSSRMGCLSLDFFERGCSDGWDAGASSRLRDAPDTSGAVAAGVASLGATFEEAEDEGTGAEVLEPSLVAAGVAGVGEDWESGAAGASWDEGAAGAGFAAAAVASGAPSGTVTVAVAEAAGAATDAGCATLGVAGAG